MEDIANAICDSIIKQRNEDRGHYNKRHFYRAFGAGIVIAAVPAVALTILNQKTK